MKTYGLNNIPESFLERVKVAYCPICKKTVGQGSVCKGEKTIVFSVNDEFLDTPFDVSHEAQDIVIHAVQKMYSLRYDKGLTMEEVAKELWLTHEQLERLIRLYPYFECQPSYPK